MDHPRAASAVVRAADRSGALALAAILLLCSCTGGQDHGGRGGEPSTTVPTPTAAPTPTPAPLREAGPGWRVFTDPARLLSFELPETWLVQPLRVEPAEYAPGSLHCAVRTPEGITAAELHTGVEAPEPPCEETERTPHYVIGSEPLDGDASEGDATDPRFVIRLITGFRFFGSYGIADRPGGEDFLACSLSNTVQGGEELGRVSFGDLVVLAPKAPADTGPGTVSFGTIGEAEEYYADEDFEVVTRVIRSLRFAEDMAGSG